MLSNAIKYTPEGGISTLLWKATGKTYKYDVADTGQGI
ncbi:hypothetical protein LEA_10760, partial [human gut metagenome]